MFISWVHIDAISEDEADDAARQNSIVSEVNDGNGRYENQTIREKVHSNSDPSGERWDLNFMMLINLLLMIWA